MKLLVTEVGTTDMVALWRSGVARASSSILYPEVSAAIAAARRGGRLPHRLAERAVDRFDAIWAEIEEIEARPALALFAGALAPRHGLRALDAIHLASLLSPAVPTTILVSWDDDLRRAALAEGVDVFPA